MKLKFLLKQNAEYFDKNRNQYNTDSNKYIDFIFDIMRFLYCANYRNYKRVVTNIIISASEVESLLTLELSNIVRARIYNYLIDNINDKEKKYINAKEAIYAYINAINDNDSFEYKCSLLNIVIAISKKYNIDSNSFIFCNIKKLTLIDRTENNAFDFNLLKIAYEFGINTNDEILNKCKNQLKNIAENNGFLFDEYFVFSLNVIDDIRKNGKYALSKIEMMKKDFYELKAKLYEKIGDDCDILTRKIDCYSISLNSYKEAKVDMNSEDVNNVRNKRDYYQKQALDNMPRFSKSIDLSKKFEVIKEKINSISDDKIINELIYLDGVLKKDKQIELIKDASKYFQLSSHFNTDVLNYDGKITSKLMGIGTGKSDKENDQIILEHAYDLTLINSEIYGRLISIIIDAINKRKVDAESKLRKIVDKSCIIKNSRKQIVSKGLIFGYNKDLESSLAILIPQFEQAIRELAYQCGDVKYKINSNLIESVNGLEYYFKNGSILENTIDENLFFSINSVFVNEHGLNYRNNFAHGCIESFNNYQSLYAWWLILHTIAIYSL